MCVVQSTPTELMTAAPPCCWADHDLCLSVHIMMPWFVLFQLMNQSIGCCCLNTSTGMFQLMCSLSKCALFYQIDAKTHDVCFCARSFTMKE